MFPKACTVIAILLLFAFPYSISGAPGRSQPTDTAILQKLGNYYYRKGDREKATYYYHRVIPKLITSGDYVNLGKIYIRLASFIPLFNMQGP